MPCGDSVRPVLPARPASVHDCGSCSAPSSFFCALLGSVQCMVAALRCWPCAVRSDIWGLLSPCSASAPSGAVLGPVRCTIITFVQFWALCSAWCSAVVLAVICSDIWALLASCSAPSSCLCTAGAHSVHLHHICAVLGPVQCVVQCCGAGHVQYTVTSVQPHAVLQHHPMHCCELCNAPSSAFVRR